MDSLESAILGLQGAANLPRQETTWRWQVRQRLAGIKDVLVAEHARTSEGWLAARAGSLLRDRNQLLARLVALGPRVLEGADLEAVRADLLRLVNDLEHHRQRLSDLAYDSVSLELGGSE